MTIAIMGAMQEEIEPLLEFFTDVIIEEYGANKYYKCRYNSHDIILAYSKIGKVFASLTATTMIEKFGAKKLLFSGVAGAISSDLKIGDLIVATKLCQHDLDITAFGHPSGYVPEGSIYVQSDSELLKLSRDVAKELGISLKEGIIATGDQFVADRKRKEWIESRFKADALEMEGASVGVVCQALGVPFFVLRAISDSADDDAGVDFDEFLKTSAKNSAEFLAKMLEKI
ncbi:MAG TPA: 5'-methylthioadenosine/adenosylhomocysteine nucleosidase [Campylobacterales bacterium]|nr:5'-methylthioadenosine/adenosylhomocysteine nucleosidase [Campylobacterales bacterium]